ncbi:MAG TPA: hypothetical protein VF666_19100 [Pyrinomonadaceae bacterium]|jgi:hypothetical protein
MNLSTRFLQGMKPTARLFLTLLCLAALVACGGTRSTRTVASQSSDAHVRAVEQTDGDTPASYSGKMIYVIVALCDNVNQGIVPVPASLGNGDSPQTNLYWGARFGVKTFFKRSGEWRLVAEVREPRAPILERLIFKHRSMDAYLVADAYRGAAIKQATEDFLAAAAGASRETVKVEGASLGLSTGGERHMVAYVGHNGLMDFSLANPPPKGASDTRRDAVILACASKNYFAAPLKQTGAHPLLWTTNLMAPEAYVLKAAIDGWLLGEDGQSIHLRAAKEYHAYQKCGLNAARRLFANGW